MLETVPERAPVDAWQARSLRLTAFALLPPPEFAAVEWWRALASETPETVTSQARIGRFRVEGDFGAGRLVLEFQGNRIDLSLSSPDDPEKWPENIPSIGAFYEAKVTFLGLTARWLEICPPIQRLAFGALLILPTADTEQTYRQLSAYLPFRLDEKGSRDFHYRINRPRTSKTLPTGTKINRVLNWSALRIKSFGGHLGQPAFQVDEKTFCLLDLDINTDAEFSGELPKEQLPILLRELIDLATEIAAEGDVP